jgi:ParB family chromosome partitioning protein
MEEEFMNTSELPKAENDGKAELFGGKAFAVVENVNIDDIYIDPARPPKCYKTEELASLAIDILENGLRNPLVVFPVKSKERNVYRMFSGEKRFRACLLARMDVVPCTVIYNMDEEACDYPPPQNYFEKAQKYAELINRGLYTEEKLAETEDLTLEELYSTLSLLIFSDDEQEILIKSGMPEYTAAKLAVMDANTRRGFMETIIHGTNIAAVCAKIGEMSAEEAVENGEHFQKTRFRIRGNGFFLNSIHHAVETMREGGVDVSMSTEETENGTVLKLVIPKS